MKNYRFIVVGSAIFLVLVLIGMYVLLDLTEDKRYIKSCFFDNEETFNNIEKFFSELYEPSLNYIRYDADGNAMLKQYDSGETVTVECDDKLLSSGLASLKEKYEKDSDRGCFYSVFVYYDSQGNMKMIIPVRTKKIKGKSAEEKDAVYLLLIYIDENYSDKSGNMFYKNWYYLTNVDYSG